MTTPNPARRRGILGRAAVLLLAPLLLAACGSGGTESADGAGSPGTTAVEGAAVSDNPTDITVLSLSPTATEMLFAIGAGDQVVAVDSLSNWPAEVAPKLTKISAYEPSVEAISSYEPDVVLISYDPGNLATQLEALGIDVWTGAAAASLEDVYAQITQLGELTGRTASAAALVASMKDRIAAALEGLSAPAGSSYFYELDDTLYSLTSNTFVGALIKGTGITNIADGVQAGNDYPQLSAEGIVDANPTLIFLADTKCCGQTAATVSARPGWSGIDAVISGNIVELDDDVASRWGPRVVDLVEQLAEAIKDLNG